MIKSVTTLLTLISLLSFKVSANDCVILLHGLARSASSMEKIEKALTDNHYEVVNDGYPSRQDTIENLAATYIPKAVDKCEGKKHIHFVTHSMGGILLRQYLSEHTINNLQHVVMLGPPNNGSEVVDKLKDIPGFSAINGPAGSQLGTSPHDLPKRLGKANFSLGIIAGTQSINLILSTMIPNPDDGKVSVQSTKLEGMADHIAMPVTHPFMMKNQKVIDQISHFLLEGKFQKQVKSSQQAQ